MSSDEQDTPAGRQDTSPAHRRRTPARTAAEAQRLDRDAEALRLALAGASVRQIAAAVGLSPSRAAAIVTRELRAARAHRDDDHAAALDLELARLDALHAAVWPAATAGDLYAVDRALRIHDRRARLLGMTEDTAEGAGGIIVEILPDLVPRMTDPEDDVPSVTTLDARDPGTWSA